MSGAFEDEVASVWRIESPKVIARVARIVRDLGLAEDFAQDALVRALEEWPATGVPRNPGAWLMTTARNRALDHLRHGNIVNREHDDLVRTFEGAQREAAVGIETTPDDEVGDDLLRLIFVACHPVLPVEARLALTLRLLGGLTTGEIARAFLVPEPTMAQRIVRAKRMLSAAHVPFELPGPRERVDRLASVLEVIYLIFNEGYVATSGDDWLRPALCEDALRLGRVLAALVPAEPEAHGLVALMEIQASRLRARVGEAGAIVRLADQDRARWDRLLLGRGLAALAQIEALGGGHGPFALQAAIAACHARAPTFDATDWDRIVALYTRLIVVMPTPVVELNRAVAVGMASGPAAGLALVDALVAEPSLSRYHLVATVRGEFLERLGRLEEARAEFARAASLTQNERERRWLESRAGTISTP